jgi:hypothetical protein
MSLNSYSSASPSDISAASNLGYDSYTYLTFLFLEFCGTSRAVWQNGWSVSGRSVSRSALRFDPWLVPQFCSNNFPVFWHLVCMINVDLVCRFMIWIKRMAVFMNLVQSWSFVLSWKEYSGHTLKVHLIIINRIDNRWLDRRVGHGTRSVGRWTRWESFWVRFNKNKWDALFTSSKFDNVDSRSDTMDVWMDHLVEIRHDGCMDGSSSWHFGEVVFRLFSFGRYEWVNGHF